MSEPSERTARQQWALEAIRCNQEHLTDLNSKIEDALEAYGVGSTDTERETATLDAMETAMLMHETAGAIRTLCNYL